MSDIENEMLMGSQIAMSDVDQRFEYEPNFAETINQLSKEISQDNRNKGFYDDDDTIAEIDLFYKLHWRETGTWMGDALTEIWKTNRKLARIGLIHTELSEAIEGIRKNSQDDKLPHRTMEEVELADALIRILDYAGAYNLDLGGAMVEKLNYNRTREHKHGKVV